MHVLRLERGPPLVGSGLQWDTLRVKGFLVGDDSKMRVIGGAQEDSATMRLPNAPIAGRPI